MFDQLTTDELTSLMAAVITPDHGFGSNRMCRMLAGNPDKDLCRSYNDLASEIVRLHDEIANTLIAKYRAPVAA